MAYLEPTDDRSSLLDAPWATYHRGAIKHLGLVDLQDFLQDEDDAD